MHTAHETLTSRLQAALVAAFGPDYQGWDPQLRDATKPEFGHLQSNLPLRLAKPTGLPPRQAGERLLEALHIEDLCFLPQLAGLPGR